MSFAESVPFVCICRSISFISPLSHHHMSVHVVTGRSSLLVCGAGLFHHMAASVVTSRRSWRELRNLWVTVVLCLSARLMDSPSCVVTSLHVLASRDCGTCTDSGVFRRELVEVNPYSLTDKFFSTFNLAVHYVPFPFPVTNSRNTVRCILQCHCRLLIWSVHLYISHWKPDVIIRNRDSW